MRTQKLEELIRILVQLAQEQREPGSRGLVVRATNQELGALLGRSPITVGNLLRKLQSAGCITRRTGESRWDPRDPPWGGREIVLQLR